MQYRSIFDRSRELEDEGRIVFSYHLVGVFESCTMTDINRIRRAINRMNSQVHMVVCLAVVMCRIHRRVNSNGVIYAGGRQDTIIEYVGFAFADMLV